ncbi:hypothetical protein HOLleu_07352 [Holothuria leucospilota]|uniref:Uncharacterized protein n=1 Tax=Holothuria leucospilota TaxID=206669 RepID=A0A9Q1CHG4_HOLLE|nr:hypothetical protein HOLleu_07352 [Holothuria leucospilota]
MPHSKRKNPIIFGGVQRSSGVTGVQTLKTLLTQYLDMPYSKRKNLIIFGGGQRSLGSLGGSLDRFHTYSTMWMCYVEKMDPIVFGGGQRSSGSPEVKKQNFPRIPKSFIWVQQRSKSKIFQEFPKLNRNTKLYFSNMLR